MNDHIRQALARDKVVDITTIGRRSGKPSRIEMWVHNIDGEIFISGTPGARDWYANLLANPDFTYHLKRSAVADLRARATPIKDPATRRKIMSLILDKMDGSHKLDDWLSGSPLVSVAFENNRS